MGLSCASVTPDGPTVPAGFGQAGHARGAPHPQPESPFPMNSNPRSPDAAWSLVFMCWLVASVSTLGALFFSEIVQLPPCVLCWYQRIFMFPLVLLLPIGLFPYDAKVLRYAQPLAGAGWLVAAFQVLLVWGFIPESIKPCTQGVSCSEVQLQWLGFVNIPLLSFLAFSTMNALLIAARLRSPK